MQSSKEVGDSGEYLALIFLQFKGFNILHKNWRTGKLEIDIIGMDGNKLVFVEVKSRMVSKEKIHPEDKVNAAKQLKIIRAAQQFLLKNPHSGPLRFDVISVSINPFSHCLYYHPDAFFPMGN